MFIDWFVLLAPLVLLPIVALLVFIGCEQILGLDNISYAAQTGLQVQSSTSPANSLFRTKGFNATWTFSKGGMPLDPVIQRPMGGGSQDFPTSAGYSDPTQTFQPIPLNVTASPTETDMQQVLAQGPDAVQCECHAIGGLDGSNNQVLSNQTPANYKAGVQTTIVWILGRDSNLNYNLNLQM